MRERRSVGRQRDEGARSAPEGAGVRASVREGGRGLKVGGEGAKRKLFTSHFDNVKSYLFSLRKLIKNLPVNLQVKFTCKIYL